MVQWLGLGDFIAVDQGVQSLIRELRSHKVCIVAKKKKKFSKKKTSLVNLGHYFMFILPLYIK